MFFHHLHHDTYFMRCLSAVVQHGLTSDQRSYDRALQVATILAGWYSPLGYICAWNIAGPGLTTIDYMMNLSLLYWASEKTGFLFYSC